MSSYKGSGPGGQHRNKTNSGIKLKFKIEAGGQQLAIESYSCDDRSSHINKLLALKKLRLKIALQIRETPALQVPFLFPGTGGKISADNKLYPEFIADVLDRVKANGGNLDCAAKMWNLSKSSLNKILFSNKKVLEVFQRMMRSAAEPTPSSIDSSKDLPIHCNPTGTPSSSLPQG